MGRVILDDTSCEDRIADRAHLRHRARRSVATIHDGGVEFGETVAIEHGAAAGIEVGIILQRAHRRLDRVDCLPAARENARASRQRGLKTEAAGGFFFH